MKITVYNCRDFDERELFLKYEKGARCGDSALHLRTDTGKCSTFTGKSFVFPLLLRQCRRSLLETFASYGVKYIVTRSIGYDHIDIAAAKRLGITIANSPYGPNGVADYATMLILMTIRKMKSIENAWCSTGLYIKGTCREES